MSPMIEAAVTDFPDPDSPTTPSRSPFDIEKEIPSTARTSPESVRKYVRRSRTSNNGGSGVIGQLSRDYELPYPRTLPRKKFSCLFDVLFIPYPGSLFGVLTTSLSAMSNTDSLQPAYEALVDCDEALTELESRCCQEERSPQMRALGDTLGNARAALDRDDEDGAMAEAMVHMENAGAQIGRLQVGCCAPNRMPLYSRILVNLTTAERGVKKATGAGH